MNRRLKSVILPCAAFAMLLAFDAHALTFTVNDTADLPDEKLGDGLCSTMTAHTCTLRAAVMQANVTGGASVTISLPAGTFGLLIPVLGSDGDYEGDLNLQSPASEMRIEGAGADQTVIDANQLFRIFTIVGAHHVTISGVTLRNGYVGPSGPRGGAVWATSSATLAISGCVFDHNTASEGGAIAQHDGSLSVIDTVFTQNKATAGRGGAIYFFAGMTNPAITLGNDAFADNTATGKGGAVAVVLNSLNVSDTVFSNNSSLSGGDISLSRGGAVSLDDLVSPRTTSSQISRSRLIGNSAISGGGIDVSGAILTLDASTLSQNSAGGAGGAVAVSNLGALFVTSSTLAGNHAHTNGGGLMQSAGTLASFSSSTIAFNVAETLVGGGAQNSGVLRLRNTIMAGNTTFADAPNDCDGASGTVEVYGSNLYTSAGAVSGCPMTVQTGGNYGYLNDLATLGALQDNGGATETIALRKGSNAIDAGDSLAGCVDDNLQPITTDQRGLARVVGLRCDIGAFEYGADSLFASGFESAAKLVINEVDYDSVGSDTAEFIEIRNNGPGPASLAGVAIVLVNGAGGAEYSRIDLSGAMELAAGAYLVVRSANVTVPGSAKSILFPGDTDQIQNGSPDGVALIQTSPPALLDALSYEGSITTAQIVGFSAPVSLLEGTPLGLGVADSTSVNGSLGRFPDGVDTNDSNTDWSFRATPTPGAANQ